MRPLRSIRMVVGVSGGRQCAEARRHNAVLVEQGRIGTSRKCLEASSGLSIFFDADPEEGDAVAREGPCGARRYWSLGPTRATP
jgi:hypothetical protein